MTAVQVGLPLELAAAAAGISPSTLAAWRVRGKKERERLKKAWAEYKRALEEWKQRKDKADGGGATRPKAPRPDKREKPYLEFLEAYEQASAELALEAQMVIYTHGIVRQDPNWAEKILIRRYPQHYANNVQRFEHTGKDGGPIQAKVAQVHILIPDNGRGDQRQEPVKRSEIAD